MSILHDELLEMLERIEKLPVTTILVPTDDPNHTTGMQCIDKEKVIEILTGIKTS